MLAAERQQGRAAVREYAQVCKLAEADRGGKTFGSGAAHWIIGVIRRNLSKAGGGGVVCK
jgi:hypothetical protein